MITTILQEKSNTYHISEPIFGRFFPNLVLVRSLRSSFIDSFSTAKKRCNMHKVSAPLSVSHVIAIDSCSPLSLSFFLFLDFIAISDCLFNDKNNYSTRACWISNSLFGATRLVGYLSYPVRPRCTQIYMHPRTFMTLRVVQFSLKIAHLSFSMGPRGSRAYGRPRLWLLLKA